jgi:hypothetical protein
MVGTVHASSVEKWTAIGKHIKSGLFENNQAYGKPSHYSLIPEIAMGVPSEALFRKQQDASCARPSSGNSCQHYCGS